MLYHVRIYTRTGLPYHRQLLFRRCFAARRAGGTCDEELNAARKWLANLDPDTIPRSICNVTFSRSSGPGGQNVNKCVCHSSKMLVMA